MQNSKWIDEYLKNKENYKLLILYGNIYDDYIFNNEIVNLDSFIEREEKLELSFFTENEMKATQNQDNHRMLGFNPEDGVASVNKIMTSINNQRDVKKSFYIKNASLFFNDYLSSIASQNNLVPHSVHLMKEFISKTENDFLIIIVSEKLESIPAALYLKNEEVSVIHIDYPSIEIREEVLKLYGINNESLSTFAKITNGRSLKEVQKIIEVADDKKIDLNKPKKVISFYDFGEIESPWTKLNESDIKKMDQILAKRVFGQEAAINYVKKILIRAKLGLSTVHQKGVSNRPIGIFFFVGPTGVGKTELAKAITEAVFGDENQFKRFDMSEYKEESSINKLIGTSPGYVGFEQGGELTNWVREKPFSVILFDEIEKGNALIWDTFLQILEDGRLTDNKGKTVYFSESIIIFTSNIGNKEAQNVKIDKRADVFRDSIKEYFANELGRIEILNRIGNNIIVFNDIDDDRIYREITKNKIDIVIENIKEKIHCTVKFNSEKDEEEVIDFIVKKIQGSEEKFGGRAVINFLETYFINEFGEYYISNKPEVVYISSDSEKIIFS